MAGSIAEQPTASRVIMVACLGAAVVTSGVQGVAPVIPAIQGDFGLSAAEVALITSVYLFPSMLSALPAGALADRIGVRPVFAAALALFGLGGIVLLLQQSWWLLLAVRAVQGAAFGVVMALSVSIIGGVVASGTSAAKAQGRRIVYMSAAEAVFPMTAGLLLALAWHAAFLLQVVALPLAVLSWLVLPSVRPGRKAGAKAAVREVLATPAFAGVQVLAALRFIFKFAVLTYYPLLAVNEIGLSGAAVGFALGAASVLTAVMAWLTEKLARRWSPSQLIGACLLAVVVSMVGMGLAQGAVMIVLALLVFGVQDGVFGVAHNVLVTEVAPADLRSTYVGVTGTVRNIGKFAAPMVFGAATLAFTISQSFLVFAGIGVASLAAARQVARAQRDASASASATGR
jgi:predicted MFS family arabinose efflux permease